MALPPTIAADGTGPTQSPAPSEARIAEWVRQLDDASYQRREAAMELLASAGVAAVDELAAAATDESPEVAWRAAEVMERIAVLGDEQEVERVLQSMQQLAATHPQFAQRAVDLKSRWREQRHARAAARLAELGARLHENSFDDWLSISPAASPLFLTPEGSVELVDDTEVTYELLESLAEAVPDAAEVITEAGETRDLHAVTEAEIDPLLERALREEELEVVRAEKVVVEEPPTDAVPAESFDPAILDPVSEDVPATEVFAGDVLELLEAGDSITAVDVTDVDDVTTLIDASEIEPYDLSFITSAGMAEFGLPGEGRSLEIGPDWKGTDDDLKLLAHLNGVRRLSISHQKLSAGAFKCFLDVKQLRRLTLQNAEYEIEDVVAYKRQRPEVIVQAIGPGMLGISGEPVAGGFRITHLVGGSGAARAGMREGDVLTSIDGQPVADFEALSWIVAGRRIGDVLKAEVRRGEKTHMFAVKLGAR